jgi:hypothetical protein
MALHVSFHLDGEFEQPLQLRDNGSGTSSGYAAIHLESGGAEIVLYCSPEQAIQIGEFCTKRGQQLIAHREAINKRVSANTNEYDPYAPHLVEANGGYPVFQEPA